MASKDSPGDGIGYIMDLTFKLIDTCHLTDSLSLFVSRTLAESHDGKVLDAVELC